MWQVMVAKAGIAATKSFLSGSIAKANVEAQNKVGAANAAAANTVRVGSNRFAAAQAGFSRWLQVENNKRILDGAGEQIAATIQNAVREDRVRTSANFEEAIRGAEQEGAQAAAAAASGLMGSVVDTVNVTTALRRSRANESVRMMGDLARYDAGMRAGALLRQGIRGMDSSMIFDNIDYGNNVFSPKKAPNPYRDALLSAAGSVAENMNVASGPSSTSAPSSASFSFGAPRLGNNAPSTGSTYSLGAPRLG